MRNLFTLLLTLYLVYSVKAQEPLDFFPHKVGDTWIYKLAQSPFPDKSEFETITITKDSIDSDGNIYILNYKITPVGDVYQLSDTFPTLKYRFGVPEGRGWNPSFMDSVNVERIYPIEFLGKKTTALEIGYYYRSLNTSTEPWKMEIEYSGNKIFAAGIGLISESDSHTGEIKRLVKCVINGDTLGSLVTGMNDLSNHNSTALENAYPNPSQGIINIPFTLDQEQHVEITIYNTLGEKVKTIVDELKEAGHHIAIFQTGGIPSGLYVCEIHTTTARKQQAIQVLQ